MIFNFMKTKTKVSQLKAAAKYEKKLMYFKIRYNPDILEELEEYNRLKSLAEQHGGLKNYLKTV
jgi:hypothetical protein